MLRELKLYRSLEVELVKLIINSLAVLSTGSRRSVGFKRSYVVATVMIDFTRILAKNLVILKESERRARSVNVTVHTHHLSEFTSTPLGVRKLYLIFIPTLA